MRFHLFIKSSRYIRAFVFFCFHDFISIWCIWVVWCRSICGCSCVRKHIQMVWFFFIHFCRPKFKKFNCFYHVICWHLNEVTRNDRAYIKNKKEREGEKKRKTKYKRLIDQFHCIFFSFVITDFIILFCFFLLKIKENVPNINLIRIYNLYSAVNHQAKKLFCLLFVYNYEEKKWQNK